MFPRVWRRGAALAAVCCGFTQFALADGAVEVSIGDDALDPPATLISHQKDDSSGKGSDCGCEHDGKDGKGDCGCSCYLFGPDEAIKLFPGNDCSNFAIGGWLSAGYHSHTVNLSQVRGDGLAFNDVPHQLNVHQAWLYAEKTLDTECGWDWGYRVDFMYGTDAQKTQGFGGTGWDTDWDNGVYGWAMPQLYGELGYGDFSVKLGHFYTLVGYEVVTAPDNFFYTHSLTMFNSEPFTHTGALGTYEANDHLTVYAGWTAGWDTGFEQVNDGSSWLGGFGLNITDDISFTYISTAGNFGARGRDAYSHSLLFDITLTEKLNYVFQSDLLAVNSTGEDDVGINQYLFYTYNDCWGFGARIEWWRDDSVSNNEFTFGVNYRPHANLVFRPEVRHDWVPTTGFDQTSAGIDAVIVF